MNFLSAFILLSLHKPSALLMVRQQEIAANFLTKQNGVFILLRAIKGN